VHLSRHHILTSSDDLISRTEALKVWKYVAAIGLVPSTAMFVYYNFLGASYLDFSS
jgi:hypothetical protein